MPATNPAIRRFLAVAILAIFCGIFFILLWLRHAPDRALDEARDAIDQGHPEVVATILETAKSVDRTRPEAVLLLAEAAVALNQPKTVVEELESTRFSEADRYRADYWKGRILLSVGQFARALHWFIESAKRKPDVADTWRWLAVASYEIGDRDRALNALRQVTNLAPDDRLAWHTIAFMHKENNEPDEALTAYRRALDRPPFERAWLLEGAGVAIDAGDFDTAEAWLSRLRDDYEPAQQAVLLATLALKKGQTAAARASIEQSLSRFPEHPGLSALLGTIHQAEGDLGEAERLFSVALSQEPSNSDWLFQRGSVRRLTGQAEAAQADFAEANRIKELIRRMSELNDAAAKNIADAQVRAELGRIADSLGMNKLAQDWYRAALACDPTIEVPNTGETRKISEFRFDPNRP